MSSNDDTVRQGEALLRTRFSTNTCRRSGGAQRLAGITSVVATGSAIGYGELGGNAESSIFAKAPNQRTTLITHKDHPSAASAPGSSTAAPGGSRRRARSSYACGSPAASWTGRGSRRSCLFPGQIKQALTGWRARRRQRHRRSRLSCRRRAMDHRGFLATLYFDPQVGTSSVPASVRYTPSPIGRIPTQIDYADYRDVGGVKFPSNTSSRGSTAGIRRS